MTSTDPTHETSESDRFWTTVNALEATPLVLTALDWTFWKKSLELAAMRAWCDLGIVAPDEVVFVDDCNQRVTASFFGRQAVNIDRVRWLMGSLPGSSGDDIERDIFGEVRPGIVDAPRKVSKLAMARGFPRSVRNHSAEVAEFRAETHQWWRQRIETPASGGSPSKRLLEAQKRFEDAQHLHVRGRSLLQGLGAQVRDMAVGANRSDLVASLTSGVGDMEETRVVDDLWRVAHGELELSEFLAAHGYHGHGEGNISATVWREDPNQVERLLAAYQDVPASNRPTARSATTEAARETAVRDLLNALPRPKRRMSNWLINKTVQLTRDLEVSKAAFLMAIDAGRKAARERGDELVADGTLRDVADVLHLTVDEAAAASVGDVRALVGERRERHEYHCSVRPPDKWTGNPAPAADQDHERRDTLTGVAGSPGRVEGLARVIADPGADDPPEPGEILVCAMTDPSWAPLFVMAEGLVIDIGGPASHGAIVARELGVPCVINTETGTTDIQTGDKLIVDGDSGIVQIVERVGQ